MSEDKKNEILEEKLDTEEMNAVSGGLLPLPNVQPPEKEDCHGGCSKNYYAQNCTATVEDGSHCWRNDSCAYFSERYTIKR